ncbi:MAG: ribosome recycling factor [Acholeplasmataceae bacterium]
MLDMVLLETEERMEKAVKALVREFQTIRTGRANPALLDRIEISYYGVATPVNQVASINVVEGTQLYIKPFDKSILKLIEQAIYASDLGLPPANDGVGIRLVLPALTEQRRRELTKEVEKLAEGGKVAIRNIRRDANDQVKKLGLPEDMERKSLDDIQKLTDDFSAKVDDETKIKNQEIMTI